MDGDPEVDLAMVETTNNIITRLERSSTVVMSPRRSPKQRSRQPSGELDEEDLGALQAGARLISNGYAALLGGYAPEAEDVPRPAVTTKQPPLAYPIP